MAKLFLRRRFLKPGYRVLDFGAGSGQFISALRNRIPDLDIVAVEANAESRMRLQHMGFATYETLQDVPGTFDAIMLVEVIEHIDDPTTFLRLISDRLRAKAKLYCTTPCGETRLGRRRKAAFETPEHVHFFTERSIALCFANAGFRSFKCETINAMTSRLSPPSTRYFKNLARPILARAFGHIHLTGFAGLEIS